MVKKLASAKLMHNLASNFNNMFIYLNKVNIVYMNRIKGRFKLCTCRHHLATDSWCHEM